MNIKRSELNTTIHLINLLMQINQIDSIHLNRSTFFEPKSIELDSEFNFITIVDQFKQPWFYNPSELHEIKLTLKDGRSL